MTPKVSIVIPTYNSEKYIVQTIQSCLDQTALADMEIVVSDDKSKDSTLDIVKSFMAKGAPIRLVTHAENKGFARNVNAAIRESRGQFVITLGHDDMLPPHHVERMLKWFTADDIALVHCNAMQIDSDGNEIKFAVDNEQKIEQSKNPLKNLCVSNFIQSCGMMFRRSAFDAIGGWDETFLHGGEWDSYIRYAEKYKMAFATDTFGYYRIHPTNITKKLRTDHQIAFEKYVDRCRAKAFAKARLTPLEAAYIKLRVFRKNLRRRLKG